MEAALVLKCQYAVRPVRVLVRVALVLPGGEGFPTCIRAEPAAATVGDTGLDEGDGTPVDAGVDAKPERVRDFSGGEDTLGGVAPKPDNAVARWLPLFVMELGELAGKYPALGLTSDEPELDGVNTPSARILDLSDPAAAEGDAPSGEGVGLTGACNEPGRDESSPDPLFLCAGTGLAVPKLRR